LNLRERKTLGGVAVLTAGLCLSWGYLGAQTEPPAQGKTVRHKKSPAARSAHSKKPVTRAVAGKTTRASARRRRPLSSRQRLAQLHLSPSRVEEIQRALMQAGYMDEEPRGQWDTRTREAMRRYQADHGFPATGLPEAKSLMKLGLGPHALPANLDPSATARATVDSAAGGPARSNPPASPDASDPTSPPRN
jgi:peptidoglycan hydrolase-like protein with peptidoglycan-binding domain